MRGKAAVYLDVTHIPRETLDRKLEGILEIYEKFMGVDPRKEPMRVFPAMHYTMGGMWVNDKIRPPMCRAFSRRANANTSITARIAWARIRWSPASMAECWPGPPR